VKCVRYEGWSCLFDPSVEISRLSHLTWNQEIEMRIAPLLMWLKRPAMRYDSHQLARKLHPTMLT
jgi:hypothetical protein